MCHECDQHGASDLEGYVGAAVDHVRESGHHASAVFMQSTVVEALPQ